MFNWKLAVLLSALIVTGCSTPGTIKETPLKELPKSHVDWPSPVMPCTATLKVETRQFDQGPEGAVVVIPYKDYLNNQECSAAKNKFISGMISMVCFYRQDLQEKRCELYYPPVKKE